VTGVSRLTPQGKETVGECESVISLVGAGPGAEDLITLRGVERLRDAEVVIWASSLIPPSILSYVDRSRCEIYDSAGMTLEDVVALYDANKDKKVVRLHSGDPSIYGAIQEQIDYLEEHNIDFEVVPGVTSVAAASAALQRELTVPGVSQSVVFTRLAKKTKGSMPHRETVSAYAKVGGTLCVFLSGSYPKELQDELLCEGSAYDVETPVAVVVRVGWDDEKLQMTRLGDLAATMNSIGARRTVLVLVGEALESEPLRSHLYNPSFAHKFRKKSVGNTVGRPTKALRSSL
jgi:precorrin-4/cobalt-precorrin-4 C11-methyltransferase